MSKNYYFDGKIFDSPYDIEDYCNQMIRNLPDGHPKWDMYNSYQVPNSWNDHYSEGDR
jgi:hypothetical protein